MNIEVLAARLDALESRIAIEALISAYANAFDRIDAELLQQIWHADATLDLPGFGSAGSRDEILALTPKSHSGHSLNGFARSIRSGRNRMEMADDSSC